MIIFFILLQFALLFFMLFHDWLPIPPFNDIAALKKANSNCWRLIGSLINGGCVIVPLWLTLKYFDSTMPSSAAITVIIFYLVLTVGTILSWWVPYLFGSSENHKQRFSKFNNTHHFLPKHGDNIIPNTLHVILHLQVWACLLISIYLFFLY